MTYRVWLFFLGVIVGVSTLWASLTRVEAASGRGNAGTEDTDTPDPDSDSDSDDSPDAPDGPDEADAPDTDGPDDDSGDSNDDEPASGGGDDDGGENSGSGGGGDDDGGENSGSGGGGDDDGGENSGSGGGDGDGDNSGSGSSGSDDDNDDHSGSNSGSNSGSGHSDDDDDTSGSSNSGSSHQSGRSDNSERSANSGKRDADKIARSDSSLELSRNEKGELVREGEVILVTSTEDIESKVAKRGHKIIEVFKMASVSFKGLRIAVPRGQNYEAVMKDLAKADPASVLSYNHVYVPAQGSRGSIASVAPSSAVSAAKAASGVRVGLVDASVDATHPMLRSVRVSSRSFGPSADNTKKHGTAVASRIAEAAPGANIVAASVFSIQPNGQEIATVDAIVRGLDWLASSKVAVINLSLAGPANPVLEAMTSHLEKRGHVLVAAVGNEGPHAPPQYPAAYRGVIGVTAVDVNDRVYRYANQGPHVDVAAAGVDAAVAKSPDDVEQVSGTSYAAPLVAVALARAIDDVSPENGKKAEGILKRMARDIGQPGRDNVYGDGIIDPAR